MADHNLFQAASIEAAKSAPPVAVTGAMLAGITLSDWVTILTLAYLALQIGLLVPRYWQHLQRWLKGRRP